MNDVLSAEEIAELFAAAEDGKLPDGPRRHSRRSRSIRKVDFTRPMKLSAAEQKRFEREHTTFCRDASMRLSSELRSPIELEVINSSQLIWQSALGDVPAPSILVVVECADRRLPVPRGRDRRGAPPGQNTMLLCVEKAMVLRMIERLQGGSYTDTPVQRDLSEIDIALARLTLEGLLTTLSTLWRSMLGLTLSLVDFASYTASLELLPASLPTVELTIEARDESASSTILLLVPHTAIEASGKSLGDNTHDYAGERAPGEEEARAIRAALGAVPVQARAEVGVAGLTMGEVLALAEGDVVRLGAAGNAVITVDDQRVHRARPGLSGSRRAVQIVEPVERR